MYETCVTKDLRDHWKHQSCDQFCRLNNGLSASTQHALRHSIQKCHFGEIVLAAPEVVKWQFPVRLVTTISSKWHFQGWFEVCAQPMRDVVTKLGASLESALYFRFNAQTETTKQNGRCPCANTPATLFWVYRLFLSTYQVIRRKQKWAKW